DAGASGLFYWRYRVSEDGGVSWGAWSENFTEYSGEVELEGTGPWMVHSDILNRAGTHGDVYSGEYLKEDKKASISNLQIISIADPRWIKYYREIRYKDTEIYCRRQPYDLMSGLPDGMSRPEGSLFPISRNRDYNGIALGYKLEFDIDTEGLQDPEDVLYVDTCFYALDRKGGLHEADVYAKNEYGRYVNLYETWFCGSSGRVTLVNERFAGQYRDAPDNIKMNTWRFSYYLPGNAVVTDKGESFDPINSKSHDYKLLVAFSIYTLTDEGKKIYYMEAGEEEQQTEWIPVFWYNLYESVFNDIVAHRVSG
ncbi:MAG: hypothetical protein PHG48_05480, partial [Eubacteriales bacterium]|nr:hypothetical protein [Eubacteriales bacterium]